MSRKYFGTDGIRGKANATMTAETALRVGMAAGRYFTRGDHRHRVVIGKDTRLSGYMIETALVAGFTSVGMEVFQFGPLPTPAVAMLTRSLRADLGVMISASHNLYEDNGIKLFGPDGYKLSDQVESEIEQLMDGSLQEGLAELGITELPELSLIINEAGNNKKIAEYVQEKLRTNLGANIKIEPIPFKERMARLQQKDFEIVLSGWGSDYADPMTYMDLFITNGGNNHSSYSNPKYDELIKTANNSGDNKVRMQAMRDAEKILGDDMPVGALLYSTRVILLNPKIKNVYFKGIGAEYYLYDAYVE